MQKKLIGEIELAIAIAIVVVIFFFSDQIAELRAYGLGGAFLIALFGSATIIFPTPAAAIIVGMSGSFDPLLLGFVAGVGSGIGELTGYFAGNGTRKILNDRIKESKDIEKTVKKYGTLGIFVLSFIPNPLFDAAGLVAGGLKIRWYNFLVACISGRVLRHVILAELGFFAINLIN
ncbi:VTT domain-containing protein [Candidatus Micrarchaeota archaeon]|nr:VTT domain-containing protein [Candidatus Micrarchaeota archaeon]